MNIYATPINSRGFDTVGTDAKYIERDRYKSVKTFLQYRRPLEQWPNRVFAIYTWSGSFQNDHTLLGYVYSYSPENYKLAQLHLANHRAAGLPERIGYGLM